MSKAFTKEDDGAAEETSAPRAPLSPGAVNYLTAEGEARLRTEQRRLVEEVRPALLESDGEEEKRRLRKVDAQIRDLAQRLEEAVVMPLPADREAAQFGATVTVRELDGTELEYRLVGVNEADLEPCWISAGSPLGRTLLGARAGETVSFQAPGGGRRLRVVRVSW